MRKESRKSENGTHFERTRQHRQGIHYPVDLETLDSRKEMSRNLFPCAKHEKMVNSAIQSER